MDTDSDSESAHSDSAEQTEDVTEQERQTIREKISTLSFEDLLKMKEEMGSKVYNETIFGAKTKKPKKELKRANKNRPRETSSKIRFKKKVIVNNPVSVKPKNIPRDPRFDPLCGSFDDKTFKSNYTFLNDVRLNEKTQLEKQFKNTSDPEEKKKIKYLMQRMDNQIREQEKRNKEEQKKYEEKKEIKDKLRHGEKPVFKKKSVKRLENLIEKFEELKKTNKLQKHIEKKSKKLSSKERRNKTKPADA